MCLSCWQKCGLRPKLYVRLDIFPTFRGVHTDFSICALCSYWLSTSGTSELLLWKEKSSFRDLPFVYFSIDFISHVFGNYVHTHTHTHTHQQKGHCLPNGLCPSYLQPHTTIFPNSHHDECTSFFYYTTAQHKREFIPKVLKVHINRIQLYLYSTSPRNRYKLKP